MDREQFYESMTNEERIAYNKSILNTKLTNEEIKLIIDNQKLMWHVVNTSGFNNYVLSNFYSGVEKEDLFQEAIIGMIKGIKTFKYNYYETDGSQNKKLPTYLCKCGKNEMLMYLRRNKVPYLSLDSEISENLKDGSSIKLEDTISEERLDCFDGFEIAKINLDKIITKKIIDRVNEKIDAYKDCKGSHTKDIMKFMFNKIVENTDMYITAASLCKIYNEKNNTNFHRTLFTRILNNNLKPLVARACVEIDDSLDYNDLMSPKRKRLSY